MLSNPTKKEIQNRILEYDTPDAPDDLIITYQNFLKVRDFLSYYIFRSMPVHGYLFPEHARSPYFRWTESTHFPEHVRSLTGSRSFVVNTFRSISVHPNVHPYFCTLKIIHQSKGNMAGKSSSMDKPEHTDHLNPDEQSRNNDVKSEDITDNTADTDHFNN